MCAEEAEAAGWKLTAFIERSAPIDELVNGKPVVTRTLEELAHCSWRLATIVDALFAQAMALEV